MKKNFNLILSTFLLIIALLSVIFAIQSSVKSNKENKHLNQELSTIVSKKNKIKKANDDKKEKLTEQFEQELLSTNNMELGSITQYNTRFDTANDKVKKFFQLYFNYENNKDYMNRPSQMKANDLITNKFAKDKSQFGNLTDDSGDSYIDTLGLHSSFKSAKTYTERLNKNNTNNLTVLVNYVSGYKDSWEANTLALFSVTYDNETHLISNIKKTDTIKTTPIEG